MQGAQVGTKGEVIDPYVIVQVMGVPADVSEVRRLSL